jgi:hypothetical protein
MDVSYLLELLPFYSPDILHVNEPLLSRALDVHLDVHLDISSLNL